jgi:ArsR family transcriptional regulator
LIMIDILPIDRRMSICILLWHTRAMATSPPTQLCCPPLSDATLDDKSAEELVVMLKALADPIRLRLINLIARSGEACACDLPAALDRSQPTISHHPSVLVNAGLLEREKRGKWAWFRVRSDQLEALGEVFVSTASPVAH